MMIQKLDERKWDAIAIKDIFECFIPGKGKGLNHLSKTSKGINYIGATNRNNGVLCSVANDEISTNLIQEGNCIGFIKNGDGSAGYAIYKKEQFISTSDVIYGYASWLNTATGIFFVAAQDLIEEKYSHGYKRNQQHLRGDKVMLPVTDSGEPDYEYMSDYVQKHKDSMLAQHRIYAEQRMSKIGDCIGIPTLDEKNWVEFRVGKLFEISRPVARNKDDYKEGNVPFVASGSMNNGVMKLCTPIENEIIDKGNCITVSPVDGSTFYQSTSFLGRGGAGSSILILRSGRLNLYNGLFIARSIEQTCSKYTYGHMGNKDSIKRERIMLPVNDSGHPDYEYMEQYAKNIMLRKYEQYIAFLDNEMCGKK